MIFSSIPPTTRARYAAVVCLPTRSPRSALSVAITPRCSSAPRRPLWPPLPQTFRRHPSSRRQSSRPTVLAIASHLEWASLPTRTEVVNCHESDLKAHRDVVDRHRHRLCLAVHLRREAPE